MLALVVMLSGMQLLESAMLNTATVGIKSSTGGRLQSRTALLLRAGHADQW
jgi:hypothetical protein